MRKLLLTSLLIAVALNLASADTRPRDLFKGIFALVDNPSGKDGREKRLRFDFGYIDPTGVAWEAAAGLQTDGASIPEWAQPVIGSRYNPEYIKAAVLHDHYCDRRVRTWEDTHRMFFHALRAQGVPEPKALTMYYAVYNFGPKWQVVRKGQRCRLAAPCIRSLGEIVEGTPTNIRPSEFDNVPDLAARLVRLEQDIAAGRISSDPDEINALVRKERPDHEFFREPSVVDPPPGVDEPKAKAQ